MQPDGVAAGEWAGAKFIAPAPCRHGHAPVRYVSNGRCVECHQRNNAAYAAAHRDRQRAWDRAYRARWRQRRHHEGAGGATGPSEPQDE